MPIQFQLVLYGMIAVAIALTVVPLVRGADKSWPVAMASTLLLAVGSTIAYSAISSWHWPEPGAPPPASAGREGLDIPSLVERTRSTPDDVEAWALLGIAYLRQQRADEAAAALERAQDLSAGTSPDITLALVDALMSQGGDTRARVNQLVEDLLYYAPRHPRALLYGAELAFSRADYALARDRWQLLLDQAEAEGGEQAREVAEVLRGRIALANQHASGAPGGETAAEAVTVEVDIEPALRDRVVEGAALFVLAREPGGGGPPVAVVRRSADEVPFEVTLSDANAMLPSRALSGFATVEIVARIAAGGTPTAQSGDLFGSVTLERSGGDRVRVVISQVYP